MEFFNKIFHRHRKVMKAPVRTLRIDGCKTTLTPKPDDAELAAQALLESMAEPMHNAQGTRHRSSSARLLPKGRKNLTTVKKKVQHGTAEYYRNLSDKIHMAHEQERRAAMRYVAYCEQELAASQAGRDDDKGTATDFAELERGLYQYQDTVEREGGELLKRWQKCLAECIVREMAEASRPAPPPEGGEYIPDDQTTNPPNGHGQDTDGNKATTDFTDKTK